MGDLALPRNRYPRSWWQVAFGHEIKPGDVKAIRYFGEDLVLWRGESGELFCQDAYCLHMGANRGIRGCVIGDGLRCPWHGWEWDGDGRNTLIPYSKEGCKPNLQIRTYPVREWYGMVMVWWAHDGRPPEWEMPELPELDSGEYYPMYPHGHKVWRVKAHTQAAFENVVDVAHVAYVHGGGKWPRLEDTVFEGHRYSTALYVPFGEGKAKTRLTPDGPVVVRFDFEFHGMGGGINRWNTLHPTITVSGLTPVDDEYCDYFYQQASLRVPGDTGDEPQGMAKTLLDLQVATVPQDFFTWENMKYLENPSLAAEEAQLWAKARRWCRQFYPPESFERDDAPVDA